MADRGRTPQEGSARLQKDSKKRWKVERQPEQSGKSFIDDVSMSDAPDNTVTVRKNALGNDLDVSSTNPRPSYATVLALGTSVKLTAADKTRLSDTFYALFVTIRINKSLANFYALHKFIVKDIQESLLVSLIALGTSYFVAECNSSVGFVALKKVLNCEKIRELLVVAERFGENIKKGWASVRAWIVEVQRHQG